MNLNFLFNSVKNMIINGDKINPKQTVTNSPNGSFVHIGDTVNVSNNISNRNFINCNNTNINSFNNNSNNINY